MWCGRGINDDVFFHITATVHLIRVAEHLGVRLPASPPPGRSARNAVFLVLTVCDEMTLFLNAAQRQTSGLTACADPFTQVCKCS